MTTPTDSQFRSLEVRGDPNLDITADLRGLGPIAKHYMSTERPFQVASSEVLAKLGPALVEIIKVRTPVGWSRELRRSTAFTVSNVSGNIILAITQDARNPQTGFEYAQAVRHGRPPGRKPPYRDLAFWVESKLGIRGKLILRVAYAISVNIGKFGTKPNNYLEQAMLQAQPLIAKAERDLNQLIITELNGRIIITQQAWSTTDII